MTLSSTAEYRVSAKGFNAVKRICAKITNQDSRRRAFKALLCMDTLADYLYSQGFKIDISKNLYKILPLNEEFEFTDIHCNGRFINVVPVVNGQYVLIPKNHTIFDVVPELYVVADYNQTTKKVKFLGCFEGDKVPKSVENGNHYVCDIKNLESPAMVEELLSSIKPEEISEKSHGLFVSFFIDYLDGVLDDTSKKRLITHLIECKECRSELVEFFDYEMIAKETKKFPEVLNDNTLDIVAAVAVNDPKYKDFKEYTIQIEKEKDEYDEDEDDENVGGKQIKSAIEDPLQILYGKNKNQKIFDLMGDRPKKTSMLDNVMSDIAKSVKKPVAQELTPEEKSITYSGSINPEYYAEGLPEGTDIEQEPQKDDLNLDFDYIPKSTQKNDEPIEIEEEDEVLNITEDNTLDETIPTKEVNILHSEKTDVDKPKFAEQLNPQPETPVSTTDELILLDEEKSVDEPEFASQIKSSQNQKVTEDNDYDDIITIEDDNDDLNILAPKKDENELPNSMDNVVYYEENEEQDEKDDVIEIVDEDNDVLGIEIPLKANKEDENTPSINLHEELSASILQGKNEEEKEPEIIDDSLPFELEYENTTKDEDLIVVDEKPQEETDDLEIISDDTKVIETPETLDIIDDEEAEVNDEDLVHFDAVDLDIVDEDDEQQQSVIPSTIEDAGIAASSLIDDFEDDSKETIAKNITKNITKDALGTAAKIVTENTSDMLKNLSTSAKIVSELSNVGDSLTTNPYLNTEKPIRESNNTISVNSNEDDLYYINEDTINSPTPRKPSVAKDNTIGVSAKENDDLIIIGDEEENDFAQTNKKGANDVLNFTDDTNSSNDDFIIINEDEDDDFKSFSIPTNIPQDNEFEPTIDNKKETNDVLKFINNTNSGNDDFMVIDEDEDDDFKSFSIPTNIPQDNDFEPTINNKKETNDVLKFINNTNSGNDDFMVIDENEDDDFKSFSIPTNIPQDNDFEPMIDNKKETNDVLKFINDTNSGNEDEDFIVIDENEQNDIKAFSVPTETTQEEDDDFIIIDDEEDVSTVPAEKVISDDLSPEANDDATNNDTISVINEPLEEESENSDDKLLDELPMIRKEDIVAKEKASTPAEAVVPKIDPISSQPVELNDDESSLLSFGDEDDTEFLNFDDNQDFLLESEDDSFMLQEEPQTQAEPQPTSQPEPQNTPTPVVNEIEPSLQTDDEDDDLIIIDDDNPTPIVPEKPLGATDNTNSVKTDDDMLIIDDDDEDLTIPQSKEPQNDTDYDDSVNFFRPAGASFDDDIPKSRNDFAPISNNNDNFEAIKSSDDDMLILDDEDDDTNKLEKIAPESTEEDDQIEILDEQEEQEEQKPTESDPQKPVSQLDLLFKSLSDREKEQIEAIQTGKNQEKENVIPETTPIAPVSKQPKSTMFNKNFKDAISAKDEAVEEGRISLKPTEEPVVDPLINTTVEKIDEDEYEEIHVDDDDKNQDDENQEVEYVYEDEDGNVIDEPDEDVEYVYEDEDGNVIDETNEDTSETEKSDENIDLLPEIEDKVEETEEQPQAEDKFANVDDDYGDFDEDSNFDENTATSDDFGETQEENPVEEPIEGEEFDEESDDESEEESEEDQELKKKAIIKKAAIAAAVALVLIGGGITTKVILSHTNARAEQQALNEGASLGDATAEEEGGLAVPADAQSPTGGQLDQPTVGGGEEGGLSIPENDTDALGATPTTEEAKPPVTPVTPAEKPSGPKAGTSNATTSDLNKAVANAFSDAPTSMTVRKASWGVGASLAADASFKAYLQQMGKSVKSALRKNLASVKGEAPASPVKIRIKMSDSGNLQDVVILKSCGNTQVDEIVLQSVKQIVAACPFPELSENTLKANHKATGSNTVKMSLTVTF